MNRLVTNMVNDGSRTSDASLAYLAALAVAGAFTLWLFPPAFLAGRGLFFFDGDVLGQISAWRFFARDVWQFPLLYTPWLNYPDGVNIAQTNSIPLLALAFKPIASLLPPSFHYFGLWHALALIGQAVAAVFLLRALGVRSIAGAASGAVFALLWPALLAQFGQPALLAHGIVLFALGCYFNGFSQRWSAPRTSWTLIAASQLALLIHPYLAALCVAIFVAFLIDEGLRYRAWARQGGRLLLALLITGVSVTVLGMWNVLGGSEGYGTHALSLDALWCGGSAARAWGCTPGGQASDGYLGLGGVLLVLGACLAASSQAFGLKAARAHAGLTLVCVLLALFAITHQVHLGPNVVHTFTLPAAIIHAFDTFFYSSRFFWVVGYVLLFVSLAVLLRRGWVGWVLIALALGLQWYDTLEAQTDIRLAARASEKLIARSPAQITDTMSAAAKDLPSRRLNNAQAAEAVDAPETAGQGGPSNYEGQRESSNESSNESTTVDTGANTQPPSTQGTLPTRIEEENSANRHPGASAKTSHASWAEALHGIAHVSMFPAYGCLDIDPLVYLPVQYLAARVGATFNTVYGARGVNCQDKHARLNQDIAKGSLVLAPANLPGQALPAGVRMAAQHGQCTTLNVMPVLSGVARPQMLLACRAEPVAEWVHSKTTKPASSSE